MAAHAQAVVRFSSALGLSGSLALGSKTTALTWLVDASLPTVERDEIGRAVAVDE